MKNEIKEILDYFKKYATIRENTMISEIEDYITNLLEYYNDNINKYEELLVKYSNLQKENERLKENAIHNDKVVDKARWNEMLYKSRNEKAIKYIKSFGSDSDRKNYLLYFNEIINTLLNILNGGDE